MAGNRILYFYLLLLSFLFFLLFDLYLFHLLLVFLLVLPFLSALMALPVCLRLRYRMEVEDDIVPKGDCILRLTAENASPLPCARVRFKLLRRNALGHTGDTYLDSAQETVQFSLPPNRAFSLQPNLHLAHCGKVELSVSRVDVCDMLGLVCLPVPRGNSPCGGCVYVLPELQSRRIDTEDAADLGLDSSTYSPDKPGGDPAEIHELRDYRPGDPRHSIHWKLSTRLDRLIVREFGLPLNPCLHFLLELRAGATPANAEYMLGTLLALSEYLTAREAVHSISWVGEGDVLRTVSVTGPESLAAALHELLALPGQQPWSAISRFAAEEAGRSDTHLVYLISGAKPAPDAEAEDTLSNLVSLGLCRKLTLMMDRCPTNTAKRLMSCGCEVQLMDGSSPLSDEELEEEA